MTLTTTRPRAVLAGIGPNTAVLGTLVGLLISTLFGGSAATAAEATEPSAGRYVLAQGHADGFYLEKDGAGEPKLVIHSDEFGSHPATDYVVHAKPSVASRTAGTNVAGVLGVQTGSTYFLLPQTNQAQQVFLGFGYDTNSYASGSINVTHEISNFQGPGTFAAWQNTDEGPLEFLNTAKEKVSFTSSANHEHINWGFTAEGAYTFDVTSTFDENGVPKQAGPVEYTFFVGETLPTSETPTETVKLSLTGLAGHYHTGNVATLTAEQSPAGVSDHFHWFTRANAQADWNVVDGAYGPKYGFVVTGAMQVKAALYGANHELLAETEPASVLVDDHGNTPGVGPELAVSLKREQGALAISVAPEAKRSQLSPMQLNQAADRYVSEGAVTGITVTDTRDGDLGWNASGRVRDMVTVDGAVLNGKYLGWTPKVISSSAGQSVTAGSAVAPGLEQGNGIKGWSRLGASTEKSRGTAVLGADVRLEAPTTTEFGDYTGVVLITVI